MQDKAVQLFWGARVGPAALRPWPAPVIHTLIATATVQVAKMQAAAGGAKVPCVAVRLPYQVRAAA